MKHSIGILLIILVVTSLPTMGQGKLKPADFGIKSKKALNYFIDGEYYTKIRDRKGAIKAYEQAVQLEPKFAEAHFKIGINAYVLKKYDIALKHLEVAFEERPNKFSSFYIAEAYFYNAKYEEAIPHYEKFIDKNIGQKKDLVSAALNIRHARFAAVAIKDPISFEPVNLGKEVNSPSDEYLPYLNADDSYLLFTARRPEAVGGYNRQLQDFGEDFYVCEMGEEGWLPAKNLGPPLNTANNEGAASLTQDGRTIYFTACNRQGGYGSCDIYYARREGNRWSAAINLGPKVNSDGWDSQPCLSPDGNRLYFTSARHGGQGTLDIWFSEKKNGEWQEAQNLGKPINTPGQESTPFMHADGQSLYFSSNFHPGFGNKDLFVAQQKADGSWDEPVNLGYPLNTVAEESHIYVSAKGLKGFINSDREGGFGGSDLYEFELDETIRPQMATFLRGIILDSLTNKPLQAPIRLVDVEAGDTIRYITSDKINGRFLMSLPFDKEYAAFVEAKGYLFGSKSFLLKQQSKDDIYFDLTIKLLPIETGKNVVLENIFFESGQYTLKAESESELRVLLNFVKKNPRINIEIQGHTDDVGSESDNLLLSQNRANAVKTYLEKRGIAEGRIIAKGYGETQPIANNKTENGKAKNRRTEVKILKVD